MFREVNIIVDNLITMPVKLKQDENYLEIYTESDLIHYAGELIPYRGALIAMVDLKKYRLKFIKHLSFKNIKRYKVVEREEKKNLK